MSTHDYNLANQVGSDTRADLNLLFQAIVSQNSSPTEPTTMFAYMWWADTTAGILKQRNGANTAWIDIFSLTTGAPYGSASQTFSVATATAAGHAVPLSQTVGRDKFINGAYQVAQKNGDAAATITAGAAINYTIDRWYTQCTGQNITAQRVAGTAPFHYAYKLLAGATGPTTTLHGQRIEGKDVAYLGNSDVVVSVGIICDVPRTVTWTAYYATVEDTFSTKTQIATGTISATASQENYSFTFNAGANAKNGIAIEYTTGSLTNSTGFITYSGHQLEAGTVPTAYEHICYTDMLDKCHYRLYVTNRTERISYGFGVVNGTTTVVSTGLLPKHMAYAPTVTQSSTGAGFFAISGNTILSSTAVAAIFSSTKYSFTINFTVSGGTDGKSGVCSIRGDTIGAYLIMESEL